MTAAVRTCSRCPRPHMARGLCSACYARARYDGTLPPRLRDNYPRFALDVDEAAVLRLLAGQQIDATLGEWAEAVRRLTARGHSAAYIGRRLRCSQRTVTRYRAKLQLAAA